MGIFRGSVLVSLTLLSACSSAPVRHPTALQVAPDLTCTQSLVRVFGREIPVTKVAGYRSRQGLVNFTKIFEDRTNTVLIHIDEDAHASMNVNGFRFDGRALYRAGSVRPRTSTFGEGMVIGFELPPEAFQRLEAQLAEGHHKVGMTCMASICKTLEANAGVEIPANLLVPAWTLRGMLNESYKLADGTKIPIQFFQLGEKTPADLASTLNRQQFKILLSVFQKPEGQAGTAVLFLAATVSIAQPAESESGQL